MRRLWLLVAFALLVLIDLSLLPTLVLGAFAGSTLSAGRHQGSSLPAIALIAVLGTVLIGLTFVVGRAWHKAPRPSRSN
jgi:membrane protein implicated in regulation of membrane protease activity